MIDTKLWLEEGELPTARSGLRYATWARERGYRASGLSVCVHRLVGAKCPRRGRVEVGRVVSVDVCWPPATDHERLWRTAGDGLVLTSEPYGLDDKDCGRMTAYATAMGLRFKITAYSPYWPGNTVMIEWQAK